MDTVDDIFRLVKAKYGSDYNQNTSDSGFSTDSESAESEDEDGEELTATMDVAILRTLARIKKKDPTIYDSSKNVFGGSLTFVEDVPCTKQFIFRGTRESGY